MPTPISEPINSDIALRAPRSPAQI